jgi:hypothetical protein
MVFIVVLMVEWDGGENFSTSVLLFPPECNVGAILRDIIRHRNLILAICVMITFRQPGPGRAVVHLSFNISRSKLWA